MLQGLRKRMNGDERGFTVIELIVVVVVIAILMAIAVPTFADVQKGAQDRGAQSNLRNALTTQRDYYYGHGHYTANVDELEAVEPAFEWTHGDATLHGVLPAAPGQVVDSGLDLDGDGNHNCSVNTSNGLTTVTGDCYLEARMVCLVSVSGSGRPFALVDVATGPEARSYFSETVNCPSDPSGLTSWSSTGWDDGGG